MKNNLRKIGKSKKKICYKKTWKHKKVKKKGWRLSWERTSWYFNMTHWVNSSTLTLPPDAHKFCSLNTFLERRFQFYEGDYYFHGPNTLILQALTTFSHVKKQLCLLKGRSECDFWKILYSHAFISLSSWKCTFLTS